MFGRIKNQKHIEAAVHLFVFLLINSQLVANFSFCNMSLTTEHSSHIEAPSHSHNDPSANNSSGKDDFVDVGFRHDIEYSSERIDDHSKCCANDCKCAQNTCSPTIPLIQSTLASLFFLNNKVTFTELDLYLSSHSSSALYRPPIYS